MPNSRPFELADLDKVALPSDPTIAPDGSRVIYVLRTVDGDADRDIRSLWQVRPGVEPVRLTRGVADTSPRWSPDGRWIAFLRAENGPAQLWRLPADGGEPEQLTDLPLGAGAPVWSPDSTRIAFSAPVDTAGASSATEPMRTDRRFYKLDGTGFLRGFRSHIFIFDIVSRSTRQVTDGDFHAGTPAWSPDGTRLTFADSLADGDPACSAARIVEADALRRTPSRIGPAAGAVAAVTWSAAGDNLLAVAAPDTEVRNNRLLLIPVDGGGSTDLTAGFDRNVMAGHPGYPGALPHSTASGAALFCVRDRGCTHLYITGEGRPRALVDGDRVVSGLSVAANRAAFVVSTAESFAEIAILDLDTGVEQILTTHALPDIAPIPVRERVFTISDGTEVHGWLLRDPAAPTPGPLLVDAHGGPHNAWNAVWDPAHAYHQVLAARGWTVLLLNPRGSDGYGEDFLRAAVGGWGVADERDFLEPIDTLIAERLVDPARIALCGYSYGGYIACWLPTRTDRFAAVVAGGVVSDLVSLTGTSDAGGELTRAEFGTAYLEDPGAIARMNPLAHAARATAPTLVLQGGADERCPVGQAEQWYTALRDRGVPAELVLYPEASHLFILDGRPSHRADYNRRIIEWVVRHTRVSTSPGVPSAIAPLDAAHWQRRLDVIATRHGIPGVVLAISHGDQMIEAAHGVLALNTGVETTVDSLFQIGSITKVWTATVIMRLVDQGKLDLDAPLIEMLPELRLSDPDTTKRITMRHLLTHTSGIDGDVFTDTGRGDDCLERYVPELADVMCEPIEAIWSYCNSGYSLAGRVIEVLTGLTWDAAMREMLFTPLGLEYTVTLPEEALLHRAAVGHVPGPDGALRRADRWMLPRSAGPAGLITARARDLLTFARMHLDDGVAPDGRRLLPTELVRQMRAEQAVLPGIGPGESDSWGLGWFRCDWNGHRVFGHDGGTIGQGALLRVLPEHRLAFTILTNGGAIGKVFSELSAEIATELAGVTPPEPVVPPADPPPLESGRYIGVYESSDKRCEITDTGDGLLLRFVLLGSMGDLGFPEQKMSLVPVADDTFVADYDGRGWIRVYFLYADDGTQYVFFGGRAIRRRRDGDA
ncbi:serine hydrolase [Nocardia uniformis]|uniref:Serine hydrolase n=1 Tax=Nocardia uniformis TaxID=53432 RepID=A0A849BXJ2_9NOCA|nr:serine hydrolase [Nocardia uniformis]NNH71293.1 serine hydrolase [Nocardia uniformis]